MKTYPYLAVIGRFHGNDEDDVFLYEGLTLDQARFCFFEDLRDAVYDGGSTDPVPDDSIYINYILTSESPIVIEERNV